MKMRSGPGLRKITPVRRYQNAKRLPVGHGHHQVSRATHGSVILTSVAETNDTETGSAGETVAVKINLGSVVEGKRLRTHSPQEERRLEEQKNKGGGGEIAKG